MIAVGAILAALALAAVPAKASPAAAPPAPVSVGLLLVAVEVRRDHLWISEALRISNAGPPVTADLRFALPPQAQYPAVHRGLDAAVRTPDGFAATLRLGRGLTEIAYSYALASTSRTAISRTFPLPVRRMEIVVRPPSGRTIRLTANRGQSVPPLQVAGEGLPRWAVRSLPAGAAVTIALVGLPVSRPWLPASGALALAGVLTMVLMAHIRRSATVGEGGHSTPQNL